MAVIAGLTVKTFAIVGFLQEDNVIEVIPSTWILNASEAKWPTLSSPVVLSKYIKQCKPIEKDWKTLQIKIYGFSNTFIGARNKANIAQDTSNLESDSSLNNRVLLKQRKRKRPARYQSTDASASENEFNFKKFNCTAPKLRKKKDSALNDIFLVKRRRINRPARYHSTDTSASENDSNLKNDFRVSPQLTEKSASTFKDSLLLKQRRRKMPARYQSTDTSSSENESNVTKNVSNSPKSRKKNASSFKDSLLLKQRRRKVPARYLSTDSSSSENESNVIKNASHSSKSRKKSDSTSNDSLILKQRSRKKPARFQTSDASENETNMKKRNSIGPKVINGTSTPFPSLDLIPVQTEPTPFQKKILSQIEELKMMVNNLINTVKTNSCLERKASSLSSYDMTSFLNLPVDSTQQFAEWEKFLCIPDNFLNSVKFFSCCVSNDVSSSVRKILSKILTNNIARNYNWSGRPPKAAFKGLNTAALVLCAIKEKPSCKDVLRKSIENAVKDWLNMLR